MKAPRAKYETQTALTPDSTGGLETAESPQDEYASDILVSLKELRAGEVIDADQSLREIRRELGIDAP